MAVMRPEKTEHGLLLIAGGANRKDLPTRLKRDVLLFCAVANHVGTTMTVLPQVPDQPLVDGLTEDALIAFIFKKFMESDDPSWPCLLPMTRSAIRAMDTAPAQTRETLDVKIEKFFVAELKFPDGAGTGLELGLTTSVHVCGAK